MGNTPSQEEGPKLGSFLSSPGIPTVVIDVGTQYTKVVFTSHSVKTAFDNWPNPAGERTWLLPRYHSVLPHGQFENY